MVLGKEMFLDAGTEWRVKWAQRGIGTFSFVGILCFIVGWSTRNRCFPNQCYCVRWDNTNVFYGFTLQEHIVCDDETTF